MYPTTLNPLLGDPALVPDQIADTSDIAEIPVKASAGKR